MYVAAKGAAGLASLLALGETSTAVVPTAAKGNRVNIPEGPNQTSPIRTLGTPEAVVALLNHCSTDWTRTPSDTVRTE